MDEPGVKGPPARLYCVRCDGKGCDMCGGRGWHPLNSCPKKMVSLETWNFISQAKMLEDWHLAPEPGGSNNQTESFLQALRFFRDEENRLKAQE